MASIESTLEAALFGATLRPSQHCRMPFDSGARGRSEHCFYGTRDSCTWCGDSAVFNTEVPHSGAIGAWIKNIDGDRESETGEEE